MQNQTITQEELKQLLSYDPETGVFVWLVSRGKSKIGKVAGHVMLKDGYIQIGISGKYYQAHRLVWLYTYGNFPDCQIDHIDGNPANNKLENLRLAPRNVLDNGQNKKLHKNSTTGFNGVTYSKSSRKFLSRICIENKRINLGYFDTAESAYDARLKAQKELWKFQPEPRK